MNKLKVLVIVCLCIVITLGIFIYLFIEKNKNSIQVFEKEANLILDIPILVIYDDYINKYRIPFDILTTNSNEEYGYYEVRNMNDYEETKIFVQLYGIKNGYEFPLPSKYKDFTIEDSGCIIINNINVSWKSQFIGESAEYTIMYNIDMEKSKYLIIVSTKDDIGTEKINKYIEKKLKKNKEFIALVVAQAASTQFNIIFFRMKFQE